MKHAVSCVAPARASRGTVSVMTLESRAAAVAAPPGVGWSAVDEPLASTSVQTNSHV
jgi:hypothetical protein